MNFPLRAFSSLVVALWLTACTGPQYSASRSTVDPEDAPKTVAPSPTPVTPVSGDTTSALPTPAPADITAAAPPETPMPIPTPTTAAKEVAVITTKFGRIVIELNEDAAPKTCANFKKLISDGFYNGTTFHRIIPGFMIQGGDPNSKNPDRSTHGMGGPGYTIPAEIGLPHKRGAVATARTGDEVNPRRESSGSQFFICVVDCPFLDGNYTVFAQVVEGMDVVDKIVAQSKDQRDNPTDRIDMQVTLEKR